jgi:hypothetical protein
MQKHRRPLCPRTTTFKAAAAGADWAKSFYQILTNQPGKDAWPITGATFILMHKAQDKPAEAAASLKFFEPGPTRTATRRRMTWITCPCPTS